MVSTARQEVGEKEEKTVSWGEEVRGEACRAGRWPGRGAEVAGGGSRLPRSWVEAGRRERLRLMEASP